MQLRYFVGMVIVLLTMGGTSHADGDFGAKTHPFLPKLTLNDELFLCPAVLEEVNQKFFSPVVEMTLNTENRTTEGERQPIHWLSWDRVNDPEGFSDLAGTLYRLDLDLSGSGAKQTVIMWQRPFNYLSDNFDAFVFDSPTRFEDTHLKAESYDDLFKAARHYYPGDSLQTPVPLTTINLSDFEAHSIFEFQGRYYFLNSPRIFSQAIGVIRLNSDGTPHLKCIIRASPDEDMFNHFTSLPGLKSYLKRLDNMGNDRTGSCSGGARPELLHPRIPLQNAAVRPWVFSPTSHSEPSDAVIRFLHRWSIQDPWSYREYQTFLHHGQPAAKAIDDYYREVFAVPENTAREYARKGLEEILAAHFSLPYDGNPVGVPIDREAAELQRALLEGNEEIAVALLPKDASAIDEGAYLFYAVEHPLLLQHILDAGASVNITTSWGKTALMMAAHMNRVDSVQVLLNHGADPNLATTLATTVAPEFYCYYSIQRENRTALMYAAENADIETMRVLVKAGAKTDAADSEGNKLAFYLEKNPFLAQPQKKMSIANLIRTERHVVKREPSFDCSKAVRSVERLICKDGQLTRQDRHLSNAYMNWVSQSKDSRSAKLDQMAWLKRRTDSCLNDKKETLRIACLQLETRARIRYLHDRISE